MFSGIQFFPEKKVLVVFVVAVDVLLVDVGVVVGVVLVVEVDDVLEVVLVVRSRSKSLVGRRKLKSKPCSATFLMKS